MAGTLLIVYTVDMIKSTYSLEECSKEALDVGVYTYTNVVSISDSAPENSDVGLAGNWFIVDATEHQYYHFIFDNIGQFFSLKTLIPDLKALIRIPESTTLLELPDYVSWPIEKLKNETDHVVLQVEEISELKIEKLHVVSTRFIRFFSTLGIRHPELLTNESYQNFVVPELRKFFLRNIPKVVGPKKIYVSRKEKSKEIRLRSRYLDYLKSNGVTWTPVDITAPISSWGKDDTAGLKEFVENRPDEFRSMIFTQPPRLQEIDVMYRDISVEDEDRLEKYFLDNGYSIFCHTNYDYPTQMGMIASCDYYVTFTGSSVLNSVVCKKDASIYVLNHNTSWPMPNHEYTPSLISDKVFCVFSAKEFSNTEFTIEQVLEKMEELKND